MGDTLTIISCILPGYPGPGLPTHLLPAFSSAASLARAALSSPSSLPRPSPSSQDTTASSLARSAAAADTKSTASPPRPCATAAVSSEQSLYSRSPDKTSRYRAFPITIKKNASYWGPSP